MQQEVVDRRTLVLEDGAHLEPRVCFGEGSEELRNAFPVSPQHAVLNVLQRENLSSNQVAHIVEELEHRKWNKK